MNKFLSTQIIHDDERYLTTTLSKVIQMLSILLTCYFQVPVTTAQPDPPPKMRNPEK